jgi:hypothetical protein
VRVSGLAILEYVRPEDPAVEEFVGFQEASPADDDLFADVFAGPSGSQWVFVEPPHRIGDDVNVSVLQSRHCYRDPSGLCRLSHDGRHKGDERAERDLPQANALPE